MKKTLMAILTLALILCATAAMADAPVYVIQTNSYWAEDGGWMVLMTGADGYNWMDNEAVAGKYNASIVPDATVGNAVKLTTKADWTSGAMYCFYNNVNLGVEADKLEMHLQLYVSDAAALKDSVGEIEIIGGQDTWIGNHALRWTIDWTQVQDGWNDLTLHCTDARKMGDAAYDPNLMKFLWLSIQNAPADVDIMFSGIEFYNHEKAEEPEPAPQAVWYDHNTVCVAGVEFRQVRSDLTNKWYNFAAIDLTNDGVQKFDLVASNVFVIGSVTVTKNGDEVVVDWKLNRQGTNDANFILENEFLTIFPDLNAVTEVEPSKFEGVTYAFGQPISIANDLGGDTNVLLYICNQATYCDNLSYAYLNPIYHARYWANLPSRVAQRNAMMELVNADIADMEMTASPMAENVVDSQPTEAYALQTESFWGVDGGWMLNMDGTITWADNDVTAGQYKMQMMVDEAQGSAVSVKAIAGQNIELMYTMFDPVKSGVSIENGVLELMVYVSDTAYLENTWSVFELISGQTSWIGGASLRWYLDANVITQPGWNKVTLKLSDAETLGEAFKPNKLKFFYFAATNVPEDVEFRLANIRLLEE